MFFKGQEHVKPNCLYRPEVGLEGVFPLALVTVGIGSKRF